MIRNLHCILFLMLCSTWCFAQPTITSFSVTSDSCMIAGGGNPYNTRARGQFTNATTGNTAKIFWGDGSSSSASVAIQAPAGSFSGNHNYTTTGVYTIKAILYNTSGLPTDSNILSMNAFCSSIYGWSYKINDANCTYNTFVDEPIFAPLDVEVRKNNLPIDTFTSYGYYYYTIPNPDMVSEFSFHPITAGTAYLSTCPATPYKVRLDTLYSVVGYNHDFGYTCNSSFTGFDLFTSANAFLRVTNNSTLNLYAGNTACTPNSGVLTLNISPKYSYVSASVPPTSVSGNTVTWNLPNLSSSNSKHIYVTLNPVGVLTMGDTAINTVSITPTTGDVNTANNTFIAIDSIRAAFDPNDKRVMPSGNIAAGQLLTYTINFENLGNDTAFNVHIIDIMSNNLDMNTFRILHASHGVGVNHFTSGSQKAVRFNFNNIMLADKTHPEANKGYVTYQVKAKSSLIAGDEVKNTARIYFDINPAVVTNTTVSKIPLPTSVDGVTTANGISIYPNPANGTVFVDNANADFNRISFTNAMGQNIYTQTIHKGVNSVNISALSSGVYYVVATGSKGATSLRFVVQ